MAEASLGDFDLARSSTFTGRLQYLLCRYAKVIAQGGVPSASVASRALAGRVLSDPGGMAGKIAISLVSDGGVTGSGSGSPLDSGRTDTQLDGVIQSVWNSGAWDNVL